MSRIVMAILLAPLLLLGCGGSDHSPWRVGEIHSDSLLTGAHSVLRCEACHGSAPYDRATGDCYACHRADFESSSFDHALVGSSTACAACHSPAGWSRTHFDHSLFQFPLTGSHLSVRCALCHIGGIWAGQPTDCKACHWIRRQDDPWNLALGDSCADCHTTAGWAGAPFDHLARTGFPLDGAHAHVPCLTCHPGHVPSGTPSGCYDCHRADFESAAFDHSLVGSSTSCAACHSTAGWSPATFDHSLFNFPLTGLHASVACASCHIGGIWAGQPTDCKACHWTRRQDDPWNLVLGDSCAGCHTTAGWAGAPFDHLARTGFPLEGAHAQVPCLTCHPGHNPSATPGGCNDCHADRALSAGHPSFAILCADCHTVAAWSPSTFDHEPAFPIASGRHSGNACTACHSGSTFSDFTCVTSCHRQAQTNEQHGEVSGYVYASAECYRCHPRGSGGDN
jgi:hypothetical protein